MSPHATPDELQAFHSRRLPAATMLRLDTHLKDCEDCRMALQRSASATAAGAVRVLVDPVLRAGPHLSWEQIEGHVDGRLSAAQEQAVMAHVALCTMCRRELHELARHGASLRRPVALAAAQATHGRRAGTAGWMRFVPPLALASVVGAVLLGTLLSQPDAADSAHGTLRQAPPLPAAANAFDHTVLDQLDALSSDAAAAAKAQDYTRLAALLRAPGVAQQPQALAALASLYAQGLGVPRDLAQAQQLWQRAAALGHAGAATNLQRLNASDSGA